MEEIIPVKKPGDELKASEFNAVAEVANRFAILRGGKGTSVTNGGSIVGLFGSSAWIQTTVEVTAVQSAANFLYTIKQRYYSWDNTQWESFDKTWDLDAKDFEMALEVGDRVSAYWDSRRKMFVPAAGEGAATGLSSKIEFKLLQLLTTTTGSVDAKVEFYYDGNNPGQYIKVYNKAISADYMFQGKVGAKGMAMYDTRRKIYVIWQLEC